MGERIEWVEIVEPRTKEHMYANLTTGECAWEPPVGVKVKRTDDNQWWELFDSNTMRFYYYNATTQKTVWHRPHNCDIIPLAKLQTLKQNTEVPATTLGNLHYAHSSASNSTYYDVPRSPSTSSSCKSAQSSVTPTLGQDFASVHPAVKTVSCQTQTSPSGSPKQRKKHHHHHHHKHGSNASSNATTPTASNIRNNNNNCPLKTTSGCQTALSSSSVSSRDSSRQRLASQNGAQFLSGRQLDALKQQRSRSESRGREDESFLTPEQENELKVQSEEIAAEVQKFFEQNEERIKAGDSGVKFPLPPETVPPEVLLEQSRKSRTQQPQGQKVRSPSFEATFVRSFVDAANSRSQRNNYDPNSTEGSPIPAIRHSLRSAARDGAPHQVVGGSATLGKMPKQKSFDFGGHLGAAPATNARFRRAGPGESASFRVAAGCGEAKIVKTTAARPHAASDAAVSSASVESTPNLPRRQKSFDMPSSMKQESWSISSADSIGIATPGRQRKYVTPPTVKEAQITAITGSPRIWGNKQAGSKEQQGTSQNQASEQGERLRDSNRGSDSPVWTRSEVAMIKSLDSGIKSSESTAERRDSEESDKIIQDNLQQLTVNQGLDSSFEQSPRGGATADSSSPASGQSPRPKPRLSVKPFKSRGETAPVPLSIARPYPHIAAHLTFSQAHGQFVLNRDDDTEVRSEPLGVASSDDDDDDDDLDMDEEVFADDEDFGAETPPSGLSSQEDINVVFGRHTGSRRGRRLGSSPIYDSPDLGDRANRLKGDLRPPSSSPNPYGSHFHPRLAPSARSLGGLLSANQKEQIIEQLRHGGTGNNGNNQFVKGWNDVPAEQKRTSDAANPGSDPMQSSMILGNGPAKVNSLERPIQVYPGDISPPNHRPQSMLVGPAVEQQLPPNTATLSRPSKSNHHQHLVGVSRSASSLTRANQPSAGLSLYQDRDMESYAQENINRHKKGLFRKRQSIQSMLTWTRESIKKPLIMTQQKDVKKDACNVFKRVQAYMGDRKVKTGISTETLALDICIRGWMNPALRDEIYMQICKQTTENPRRESLRRGWELMAILLTFYPPSQNLLSYLESYISRNSDPVLDIPEVQVSHYAQHCARKLDRAITTQNGSRSGTGGGLKRGLRKPTKDEVEQAKMEIFHPSMFGNTLEEVVLVQKEKFPQKKLPWIQTTLSEMVLQLNGAQTEGIFRVPGDIDEVNALKVRMDRWLIPIVSDPHVPTSLLKLWYRELAEPLIPPQLYPLCVENPEDPEESCRIVEKLPRINRLVLAYLIRFLQIFIRPENIAKTKMDANNLAMVMAPNILRCESEDPKVIFENTRKEMAFLRTLMENYDTSFMEGVS